MTYPEQPPACGGCYSPGALVPLPDAHRGRAVAPSPRRRLGAVRAGDLRPSNRLAPYGPPWDAWRLGDPHALLLRGPPGGGKSTLASKLAISAARRVDALYVAAEEGHSQSLSERMQRCGLDDLSARRLLVSDARDALELEDDLAVHRGARLVVLDSVTELRVSPAQVATALQGRSWIAIAHVNARGGTHGGHDFDHAVDAVFEVVDFNAKPIKNRFGAMETLRVNE